MISFRTQKDAASSILLIVSLIAIAGIAAYMAFVPLPSAAGMVAQRKEQVEKLEFEVDRLRTATKADSLTIAQQVRPGTQEQISPLVLAEVTKLAKSGGVELKGFRPQRTLQVGELEQLPFVFTVEGPYIKVLNLIRSLEQPSAKLSVGMMQFTSADGGSDLVAATVTVHTFANANIEAPASPTASNRTTNGKA